MQGKIKVLIWYRLYEIEYWVGGVEKLPSFEDLKPKEEVNNGGTNNNNLDFNDNKVIIPDSKDTETKEDEPTKSGKSTTKTSIILAILGVVLIAVPSVLLGYYFCKRYREKKK